MCFISLGRTVMLACGIGLLSACASADSPSSAPAPTADTGQQQDHLVQDAWLDTRLETAYLFNRHLNNFNIQTDVDNGVVLLTGTVRSNIDRDLAEEIARSLKGVEAVNNHLVVRQSLEASGRVGEGADFGQKVDDATTTARVKTRLVANENLAGLAIDVDTRNSIVTLAGDVGSDAERQLAELIAKNTPDVQSVENELEVRSIAKGS